MIFMRARTGAPLDRDSNQAVKGRADEAFVSRVLANAFFGQSCPKSLDRNAFAFADIGLPDFSMADEAATVSALTPLSSRARGSASGGGHRATGSSSAVARNPTAKAGNGGSRWGRLVVTRSSRRPSATSPYSRQRTAIDVPNYDRCCAADAQWRCRNAAQLTGPLI